MNFQSLRWANPKSCENRIAWKDNPDMLYTRAGEEINGVRISWEGIQSLVNEPDIHARRQAESGV